MADECDIAEAQEERARASAIDAVRRSVASQILKPRGACHYCGESLLAGVFCPAVDETGDGCARDYDIGKAAKLRNGTGAR